MGAAVKRVVRLDAVPDHLDVAVLAGWGERVDRTLEAVEGVGVAASSEEYGTPSVSAIARGDV
jgi:hypothetical protein